MLLLKDLSALLVLKITPTKPFFFFSVCEMFVKDFKRIQSSHFNSKLMWVQYEETL